MKPTWNSLNFCIFLCSLSIHLLLLLLLWYLCLRSIHFFDVSSKCRCETECAVVFCAMVFVKISYRCTMIIFIPSQHPNSSMLSFVCVPLQDIYIHSFSCTCNTFIVIFCNGSRPPIHTQHLRAYVFVQTIWCARRVIHMFKLQASP